MALGATSLSDSLITVVVGIAATAAFGTVLAPWIKGRIDRRGELLKSRVDLIDGLAIDLWSYWKLALRIAYSGAEGDKKGYELALAKWNSDEAWEMGNRIQAQISKAGRLIPNDAYIVLKEIQNEVVNRLDAIIRIERQRDHPDWASVRVNLLAMRDDIETYFNSFLANASHGPFKSGLRALARRIHHACS